MGGYHRTVRSLIELNSELIKPKNCIRSIAYELCKQFLLGSEMTAAECIEIVDRRGVVRLIRSLDTTLGHHRVGIADAKLCNYHGLGACIRRLDRS